MSQIANAANSPNASQPFESRNSLNDIDLDTFLELMIAELQNQDPLNPLENDQLLAQISQIREVGATDRLTETLDSVLLGQNIASATNLIGAEVVALDEFGERIGGSVQRVTIDGGVPNLEVAVGSQVTAGSQEGEVADGNYVYEVVWDGPDGTMLSTEYEVDTRQFGDSFNGSIRINHLPETSGEKRIYRTDRTGSGDRKLVGVLPTGQETALVDATADANRTGEPLDAERQRLTLARRVTVELNNIAEIRPPAQ